MHAGVKEAAAKSFPPTNEEGDEKQAMNALEMEEWRKVGRTKKCKMARPNDKLVAGARMI